jgi:hypothetical protein
VILLPLFETTVAGPQPVPNTRNVTVEVSGFPPVAVINKATPAKPVYVSGIVRAGDVPKPNV